MDKVKNKRFDARLSMDVYTKFHIISKVNGKTMTAVLTELIENEFKKNVKYLELLHAYRVKSDLKK